MKKVLIIGAGPAGISAAIYLARAGKINVKVVHHGESALSKADKIENYFGFPEPISGQELLSRGIAGAKRLGAVFSKEEVTGLQLTQDMRFEAETTAGKDTYDAVMIATGAARRSPDIRGLKEAEGHGVSYCAVCDAFFFRGRDVAVIGGGEYAAHEASALMNTASSVTILTNGSEPFAKMPEGTRLITKKIAQITGQPIVDGVSFEDGSSLSLSGIFVAIGTAGSTELAGKLGAATDGRRIIVDETMSTNIPGLYAGGDCTGGLMQAAKAVSDGAIAAMGIISFLKNR